MDSGSSLSVILLGRVPDSALQPLRDAGISVEVITSGEPPSLPLATEGRRLNRLVDGAASDWLLVLREREAVSRDLAAAIASVTASTRAWGYRIAVDEIYRGRRLRRRAGVGEIRLFHRRRARFVADPGAREMMVNGSVVRLHETLVSSSYATARQHAAELRATRAARTRLMQTLTFLRAAPAAAAGGGWNAVVYTWVESGFSDGRRPPGSDES